MSRNLLCSLAFVACIFSITASAQELSSAASFGACGNPNVRFVVKTESALHTYTPDPGKALVYFIEKDVGGFFTAHTRIGMDGHWLGATEGNSYFAAQIDPGPHHLCADTHKGKLWVARSETALAHFTAQPAGVYYFEVRDLSLNENEDLDVALIPLDSDEGASLAGSFPVSNFHRK